MHILLQELYSQVECTFVIHEINTGSIELNNEIYISLNILNKSYAKYLFDKSSYGCAIKFYVESVKGFEFVVSRF